LFYKYFREISSYARLSEVIVRLSEVVVRLSGVEDHVPIGKSFDFAQGDKYFQKQKTRRF